MTVIWSDPVDVPGLSAEDIDDRAVRHEPDRSGAGDTAILSTLTVRELLARLARTEEQLMLLRLKRIELAPSSLRDLLRDQNRIVAELRRRR